MPFITDWLKTKVIPAPAKAKAEQLVPQPTKRLTENISQELATTYLDPWEFRELFDLAGLSGVLKHLRKKHFPKDERTKKGNFGETLALAWIRDAMGYEVPLVKRRWAMNRERSQHGEDVIGFVFSDKGKDKLLIVEAKFYLDNVTKAIKVANNTIVEAVTANECYSLHAILSLFQERNDLARYKKVKRMFDDYSGSHYEKAAGIFLVTVPEEWKETYFQKYVENNGNYTLNCWALVDEDIVSIYNNAH